MREKFPFVLPFPSAISMNYEFGLRFCFPSRPTSWWMSLHIVWNLLWKPRDLCAICQFLWKTFQPRTGSKIIVRPEEAFIVILVLILWIGAIGLFFHRWGKIRMLEPYTPKFEAELHRPSCPLVSMDPIVVNKRMSLAPLTSFQCGSTWNPSTMGVGRGKATEMSANWASETDICLPPPRSLLTFLSSPPQLGICRPKPLLTTAASEENKIRRRHSLAATRGRMRGLAKNQPGDPTRQALPLESSKLISCRC